MTDSTFSDIVWATAVMRRHTPLFLSLHISGQTPDSIQRQTGLPVGFTHLRRCGLALQYSPAELSAARSIIHHQVTKLGLQFFEDFSKRCLSCCEMLLQAAENVSAQIRSPSCGGPALEGLLQPYFDAAIAQAGLLSTMVIVQRELEAFLDQFVTARIATVDRKRAAVTAALKMTVDPTDEVRNLKGILDLGRVVQSQIIDYNDWIAV